MEYYSESILRCLKNGGEKMGVFLILLDAFSYKYINPRSTPFLFEILKAGNLRGLEPLFAFMGIEATIFSGEWPFTHNVWTEFKLKTKNLDRSSDKLLSAGIGFLDNLKNENVSKLARLLFIMTSNVSLTRLTPNMIPPGLLPCFEPSMKKSIMHPAALNVSTIFDWLRFKKKKFICIKPAAPLKNDLATVEQAKRVILHKKPTFAWVKLNSLDKAGHTYGPNLSMLREDLARTDALVEDLTN